MEEMARTTRPPQQSVVVALPSWLVAKGIAQATMRRRHSLPFFSLGRRREEEKG